LDGLADLVVDDGIGAALGDAVGGSLARHGDMQTNVARAMSEHLVGSRTARLAGLLLLTLTLAAAQGCASIAEGVTRGLIAKDEDKPPRPCDVTGPAFQGLSERLRRLELSGSAVAGASANPQRLKVMMVHGIGTHPPGYSARFQRNLTAALGLTRREQLIKEIGLRAPLYFGDESLGHLRVFRYLNEAGTREMLFYELSWSEITAPAKSTLAYDTSGEYAYRRSEINHKFKAYLNERMADSIAYLGESNQKITASVSAGICWMTISDWDDLPPRGAPTCDGFRFSDPNNFLEDEFVFITHSLGSRIVTDAFQEEARSMREWIDKASDTPEDKKQLEDLVYALKHKEMRMYMLANQLPLLELGFSPPPVVGQIGAYCEPDGSKYDDRFFSKLSIIAFSDPNDALSYAIPADYEDMYMDSRLCPAIVNVSVNVADSINIFGIADFVNPMSAHDSYEDDERVIGLMVDGIGHDGTDPTVAAECSWLETVD
jgi:hypothetical protein